MSNDKQEEEQYDVVMWMDKLAATPSARDEIALEGLVEHLRAADPEELEQALTAQEESDKTLIPDADDPEALYEAARKTEPNTEEWERAMEAFAWALASRSAFMVDTFAKRAKKDGLITNMWTLKTAVTNARRAGAYEPTHDTVRDIYLQRHPDIVYGLGRWRRYREGVYLEVEDAEVQEQMVEVLEELKGRGVKPSDYLRQQVLNLVRTRVGIATEQWNVDPELLVCTNGVLHIPTRVLREPSPQLYLTSGVPYAYDPEATCPYFLAAIGRLDDEAAEFLQNFSGYALTTDMRYEISAWLHGQRGCGKSTIIEGLTGMLGTRCGVLSLAQVMRSRFALHDIVGKTLVYDTDIPDSYLRSTVLYDKIVSGEEIVVEQKYKPQYTIRPTAKVLWSFVTLPRVKDSRAGIFRRVAIIEVPALSSEDTDVEVKERIRNEAQGILNWALEGLDRVRSWGTGRFEVPASVRTSTEAWRMESAKTESFVTEMCEAHTEKDQLLTDMYDAYQHWCIKSGRAKVGKNRFSRDLQDLGIEVSRGSGNQVYVRRVRVDVIDVIEAQWVLKSRKPATIKLRSGSGSGGRGAEA